MSVLQTLRKLAAVDMDQVSSVLVIKRMRTILFTRFGPDGTDVNEYGLELTEHNIDILLANAKVEVGVDAEYLLSDPIDEEIEEMIQLFCSCMARAIVTMRKTLPTLSIEDAIAAVTKTLSLQC